MAVYFIILVLILGLGVILCKKDSSNIKKIVYLSVVFTSLYLLSVFRYGIGNDYYNYTRIFMDCANANNLDGLFSFSYEPAFYLLNKFISLFTRDMTVVFAVYAFIALVPAAVAIYKYSQNLWLSCFTYICLTFFYASMGYVRQSIAAAIILLSYKFFCERKHIAVIIVTLIATMFHYTAVVTIIFYLIALIKPTKKYLIIYGGVNIAAYIVYAILKSCGINPMDLAANIATAIFKRNFNIYIESEFFTRGLGIEYVIMPLCVLAFVMVSYFLGWKEKKGADIMLNFVLLTASCWLFTTQVFIIERFSMFIFIFIVLIIPSVMDFHLEQSKRQIKKQASKIKRVNETAVTEEKIGDSYYLIICVTVAGLLIYNFFSAAMGFHGVFPYITNIAPLQSSLISMSSDQEIKERIQASYNPYEYMLLLKNSDYDCYIVCAENDPKAVSPVIISSMEELGLDTERIMSGKGDYIASLINGELNEYTGKVDFDVLNGASTLNASAEAGKGYMIIDDEQNLALATDGLSFVVLDSASNSIVDVMGFDLSSYDNKCYKMNH